jgi:hypothetical protein
MISDSQLLNGLSSLKKREAAPAFEVWCLGPCGECSRSTSRDPPDAKTRFATREECEVAAAKQALQLRVPQLLSSEKITAARAWLATHEARHWSKGSRFACIRESLFGDRGIVERRWGRLRDMMIEADAAFSSNADKPAKLEGMPAWQKREFAKNGLLAQLESDDVKKPWIEYEETLARAERTVAEEEAPWIEAIERLEPAAALKTREEILQPGLSDAERLCRTSVLLQVPLSDAIDARASIRPVPPTQGTTPSTAQASANQRNEACLSSNFQLQSLLCAVNAQREELHELKRMVEAEGSLLYRLWRASAEQRQAKLGGCRVPGCPGTADKKRGFCPFHAMALFSLLSIQS